MTTQNALIDHIVMTNLLSLALLRPVTMVQLY